MPQLLRVGPYSIYFWSNENNPLEPIHVHISEGRASANATKLWISSTGKVVVCNNNSNIPITIPNQVFSSIGIFFVPKFAMSSEISGRFCEQAILQKGGSIEYYVETTSFEKC